LIAEIGDEDQAGWDEACRREAAIPLGPGAIRSESGHDTLIFCRILENIPDPKVSFQTTEKGCMSTILLSNDSATVVLPRGARIVIRADER
jgi:hypothetical protein